MSSGVGEFCSLKCFSLHDHVWKFDAAYVSTIMDHLIIIIMGKGWEQSPVPCQICCYKVQCFSWISSTPVSKETSGAYCIKLLPEKNSGYFNQSFLPMVKSMVNSSFTGVSDFTRVFTPVRVLCNGPLAFSKYQNILSLSIKVICWGGGGGDWTWVVIGFWLSMLDHLVEVLNFSLKNGLRSWDYLGCLWKKMDAYFYNNTNRQLRA